MSAAALLAPGLGSATPATEATATLPAAATPPPTLTDAVLGITASEDLQRATLARLGQAGQWRELADRVAALKGFGDSALNFSLLAWVPTVDIGLQAQNALRVAILRKLESAGIAIPFPQRDLQIRASSDGERQAAG